MDESALILSAQRGDVDAFNTLVLAYQGQVYNVAYRIMGEVAPAADAAQETFISAHKSLKSYRGGSFKGWLLRMVTNECYDALRYNKRRPSTSLDALGENPDGSDDDTGSGYAEFIASGEEGPAEAAERRELNRAIAAGIKLLPPDQRITFVLTDVQGMSYDEVADTMQTSLGTVKSRLSRARARLRDYLLTQTELISNGRRH